MIIAFYPGAGGNRYLRMLSNKEWATPGISYDNLVTDQLYRNRYLIDPGAYSDNNIVLTHCLNSTHILEKFPGHEIVFILGDIKKCLRREWKLAGCTRYLSRQTKVELDRIEHYVAFKDSSWPECHSVKDLENLPEHIATEVARDYQKNQTPTSNSGMLSRLESRMVLKVQSAHEIIQWHKKYYTQYPIEINSGAQVIDLEQHTDVFSKTMQQELDQYNSEIFDEVWDEIYNE